MIYDPSASGQKYVLDEPAACHIWLYEEGRREYYGGRGVGTGNFGEVAETGEVNSSSIEKLGWGLN